MRDNRGITLVALVVTIIILIILAGVSINLTLGENGIIKMAQNAKQEMEQQAARELIELTLLSASGEKATNSKYNENEWLNSYILEENSKDEIIIIDNIININGWKFEIDRSIPKIITELGKGVQDDNIQITLGKTIREDYYNGILKIDIVSSKDINSIQINREKISNPNKENGKYVTEKTIEKNGTYKVIVIDSEGNYNVASIEIDGITENIEIYTAEDMVAFRESVNSGRTYEGKIVKLMSDIDLQGSEQNRNWIEIGNETNKFKGTFEGNNFKITNLYNQNTQNDNQGLFGYVENAVIQNIEIKSSDIDGNLNVGALIGTAKNTTIKNCKNEANIYSYKGRAGGIVGSTEESGEIIECSNSGLVSSTLYWNETQDTTVGGIVGFNFSTIKNCNNSGEIKCIYGAIGGIAGGTRANIELCVNNGNVSCTKSNINGDSQVAGITAYVNGATIKKCSNNGNIDGPGKSNGGIVANLHIQGNVEDCYNTGRVSTQMGISGGIVGIGLAEDCSIENCYNLGKVICTGYANDNHDASIGGIVGLTKGTITKCYNEAEIESIYAVVGGIVGIAQANVENCYNKGDIICTSYNINGDSQVGGIVGYVKNATIKKCYNNGKIDGAGKINAGIVGNLDALGKVEECYNTGIIDSKKGICRRNCRSSNIRRCINRKML